MLRLLRETFEARTVGVLDHFLVDVARLVHEPVRHQKQAALAIVCRVLEQRRGNVIQNQMARKDSGALFDIANNFHIRHGDGSRVQQKDYEDYYLDWIFWLYLSTAELTNRVLDDQALTAGRTRADPQTAAAPGR
ncbi:hypothetical protein [Nocardia xishanensis]